MINSMLEKQAKGTDKLLCRLIEEQDGKKLENLNINTSSSSSSSSCALNFPQTNLHTSVTSVDGTTMPNPSAQPVDHFHSRTTIEGKAPTF
jgi:hypothetical protein